MQNLYGVVGDPIAQSWSPIIHTQLFQMQGFEGSAYIALHITPRQLEGAVDILRGNFRGFNITIPTNGQSWIWWTSLPRRRAVWSSEHGEVRGREAYRPQYGWGGVYCRLAAFGLGTCRFSGTSLGGGRARVAAYELAEMGCSLTIGSRTLSTAEGLAEEITSRFPHLEIAPFPANLSQGTYDVVVNATPAGMGALKESAQSI